ncbi:hypothetical protein L204_103709 [Cryptococcus depauperatus]|nr:hypothetical protein L204_02025 [Cryptococcus depauperatus CBS 7855]
METNASESGSTTQWPPSGAETYPQGAHRRSGSNARAYAVEDGHLGKSNGGQALYIGNPENYVSYQQRQGGYGAGISNASSPSTLPSSRRASGQNSKITPPPGQANPPPSGYYTQGAKVHQSSYQPTSAPPQVLTHNFNAIPGQPQSAHTYSQYPPYSQHAQQPAPWNYPHNYSQHQQSRHTPTQSNTLAQSSGGAQHRHPPASYDYASSATTIQQWPGSDQPKTGPTHQQPWLPAPQTARMSQQQSSQQAQPTGQGSTPTQGQGSSPMIPQGNWQGYSAIPHHSMSGHMMPNQGYWAQPQWAAYYGAQPPHQTSHSAQSHVFSQAPGGNHLGSPILHGIAKQRSSQDKRHSEDEDRDWSEEYPGLGKRFSYTNVDGVIGDDKGGKKKKKGEEKEKPAPKARSHLHPPKQAPSAWQLFFADELIKAKSSTNQSEEIKSPGGTMHSNKLNVAVIAKEAGVAYANLSEERKKYYAEKVKEHREQYAKDLAAWQATLTPEDIRAENAFRAQQRKEGKSRKGNIKDPNAPKKPLSAYFLFLKAIRENEIIREQVWGDESETTKQSVMAAQKWRSLTDNEKKPYLEQAEHDKQAYEVARKQYEDDAAARARGEDIPVRPVIDISSSPPKPPASMLRSGPSPAENHSVQNTRQQITSQSDFASAQVKLSPQSNSNSPIHPVLPTYQPTSPAATAQFDPPASLNMEEFQEFTDSLEMDLSGLGTIDNIGVGGEGGEGWDELQQLMDSSVDYSSAKLDSSAPHPSTSAIAAAAPTPGLESAELSVAPTYNEAEAETAREAPTGQLTAAEINDKVQVQRIAERSEGKLVVPPALGVVTDDPEQGIPVVVGSRDAEEKNLELPTETKREGLPAVDGL